MPLPEGQGFKTWTLPELYTIYTEYNKKAGIQHCDMCDWLKAHKDDGVSTVADFEDFLYSDPVRGAINTYTCIRTAHDEEEEPLASVLQEYYAEKMAALSFEPIRSWVEQTFLLEIPGGVSEKALEILRDYMIANHPYPKEFFDQKLAHLPPNMPELEPTPMPDPELGPDPNTVNQPGEFPPEEKQPEEGADKTS